MQVGVPTMFEDTFGAQSAIRTGFNFQSAGVEARAQRKIYVRVYVAVTK